MNFSKYLKLRKSRYNISSTTDHYNDLGGEKELNISLRHFREIESGNHTPSEKVLTAVFRRSSNIEKRVIIIAYFNSILPQTEAEDFTNYLEKALLKPPEFEEKSIWTSDKEQMQYTQEQLQYLYLNEDALIFHKYLVLFDKIPKHDIKLENDKLDKLISLKLVDCDEHYATPSRNLYRLPIVEKSSPRLIASKNNYILKNLDVFLKREGDPNQHFDLDFAIVNEDASKEILNHLKSLKEWVRSLAIENHSPPNKAIIFSSFVRELSEKDFT